MFCEKCGNSIPEGTKFCDKCGAAAYTGANSTGQPVGVTTKTVQPNNSNKTENYSFRIYSKRNDVFSMIKVFKGSYKADFALKNNRLTIVTIDDQGETVYSAPYYLIKSCDIKESVSVGMIFALIIGLIIGIGVLACGEMVGLAVIALVVIFGIIYGIKKAKFTMLLNNGNSVKLKLRPLKKQEKSDKLAFMNSIRSRMQNAVNTGEPYEAQTTIVGLGDVRKGVKANDKKALVEEIKNKD